MMRALRQHLTNRRKDSQNSAWDEAVESIPYPLKYLRRPCPPLSIGEGPEVRPNSQHRTTLFWEVYT
jgi:hypothetical protein